MVKEWFRNGFHADFFPMKTPAQVQHTVFGGRLRVHPGGATGRSQGTSGADSMVTRQRQVSAGGLHTVLLRSDGHALCVGNNRWADA